MIDSQIAEPAEKGRVLTLNRFAAERLREAATLLSHQHDNPYRVGAFRRAADAVAALDRKLRETVERDGVEVLEQIPGIGALLVTNTHLAYPPEARAIARVSRRSSAADSVISCCSMNCGI